MEYLSQQNLQQVKIYLETYWEYLLACIISPSILIAIGLCYAYKNKFSLSLISLNKLQIKYTNFLVKRNVFFYLQIGVFVIFFGLYVYLILYGTEFAYHDNYQFTYHSLDGRFFGMPIWRHTGRYWPLGLQEYNLISLFSKTPLAYHLFSIAQLTIIIPIIYLILRPLNITGKLLIILIIMVTPSFVISFFGLIFPERNLIFWLAIFIFCYQEFIDSKSIIYFCAILLATQFLLFYKEPMFLLIGGFATIRLAFQSLTNQIWNNPRQYLRFIQKNWHDFSLIILSIIFVIQYLIVIVISGNVESSYSIEQAGFSEFSTLINYLRGDIILLIFLLVFCVRILFLLTNKKSPDLVWDSLAVGNLLYFCAYIKLKMFSSYYLAPVDFIATLYSAKLLYPIIVSKHKYKILGIIILVTAILLQNFHYSSYAILSRKKTIEARVEITNFLARYIVKEKDNNDIHLFLPLDGYHVMEFSSFLYYKGFPILPKKKTDNQKKNLIIYTPKKYPKNLCIDYAPFKCYYTDNSKETDLTIFFPPYNKISNFKIKEFKDKSVKIYHYQPKFKGIEKALLFFATENRIDQEWFNAYIFINKKN